MTWRHKYKVLRAAVVLVLDAEIGDDATGLRLILNDALNEIEGGDTNADESTTRSNRGNEAKHD